MEDLEGIVREPIRPRRQSTKPRRGQIMDETGQLKWPIEKDMREENKMYLAYPVVIGEEKIAYIHFPPTGEPTKELWFELPMSELETRTGLGRLFNCPELQAVQIPGTRDLDFKCQRDCSCYTCDVYIPFKNFMRSKSIFDWFPKQPKVYPKCSRKCH